MDYIAVYILLGFVCNIQGKHEGSPVSTPEVVEEINTLNVGYDWFILIYKSSQCKFTPESIWQYYAVSDSLYRHACKITCRLAISCLLMCRKSDRQSLACKSTFAVVFLDLDPIMWMFYDSCRFTTDHAFVVSCCV